MGLKIGGLTIPNLDQNIVDNQNTTVNFQHSESQNSQALEKLSNKIFQAKNTNQNISLNQTQTVSNEGTPNFETIGGAWRKNEKEDIRFYRDGEDISKTTLFDKEYFKTGENEFIRLNKRGALIDYSPNNGKVRPSGISDFDWYGWEKVSADKVPAEYSAEGKTISFSDTANADNPQTVLRRYLQQNIIGKDWIGDVDSDEQAVARASELGVKINLEKAGINDEGQTVYQVKISDEDLGKLRQVKAEWQAKRAEQIKNNAYAQNETNQMFLDKGRVLWNSGVNLVEGGLNSSVDATTGGATNAARRWGINIPQADFSGVKLDYQSEMMRRNLNGKVDGEGIKRGQATELGVTIGAPLVVGRVNIPKAPPQTLEKLEAFPNLVVKEGKWNYFFDRGIKPDPHNVPRAIQNKAGLEKLGIFDDAAGKEKLFDLFEKAIKLPVENTHISKFGTTITKHIKVNDVGGIDIKYFYPNSIMNAKPQITTIIPKIYKSGVQK